MSDKTKDFDLVCVGHICHDLIDGGFKTGGAVYFASHVALKRGMKVCVLSSLQSEDESLFEMRRMGVVVRNQESQQTTCFRNKYENNQRIQYLPIVADKLQTNWILQNLPETKAVFICPVADEIDVEILQKLNVSLLACSIQGWLRTSDKDNMVIPKAMDWNKLRFADIVFLSYEDIDGLDGVLDNLCQLENMIIVTDGEKGVDVFVKGEKRHFPSIPTGVVDPTGAGDTFATAFIIRYLQDNDLNESIQQAHRAASKLIGETRDVNTRN